tara:strand:+ start:67 stop:1002 length:936 start_codon:yes stop_codon:yes gene_type:complete
LIPILELLQNYNPKSNSENFEFYSVIIEKGDTLRVITNKLYDIGLIKNKEVFQLFATLYNYDKSIKSGHYKISSVLSIKEILKKLNTGEVIQNRITIPEGMTNSIIFETLINNELLSGALDLSDFPKEGYLAPDTYFYEKGEKRISLLNRIRKAQSKKIVDIWGKRTNNNILNSTHELVILASIIEKESGNYDELDLISSVLHNRLRKKTRLQADPTVIFGITMGKGNLNRALTKSDLRKHSDYNTYTINGLPPNPICNPGEAALKAAANPLNSKFYYYVSNSKGGHFFSMNLEEHNKNVRLYKSLKNRSN